MTESLDWKMLLSLGSPWAHLACCPEREIDNFVGSAPANNRTLVRIIRGKRCETKKALLQEWAAALQFPYYFGINWDAFEECINDLEWLSGKYYVIFVTQVDLVLPNLEDDFRIFIDVLKKAAEEWARGREGEFHRSPIPFRVVFQCEPEREPDVLRRLKLAGVELS